MMVKTAFIGALAPLLLFGAPLRADWRTPIGGAEPILSSAFLPSGRAAIGRPPPLSLPGANQILPSRFTPMGYEVTSPFTPAPALTPAPSRSVSRPPADDDVNPTRSPAPAVWSLPLVDRRLTPTERTADLATELQDAIARVEPMYDPTRLDGPDAEIPMAVSSGTAAMNNVFGDRWRLASPDPNVNVKTAYLAMAWQMTGVLPCDAFFKNRRHGFGDATLTALSEDDCGRLSRYAALSFDVTPTVAMAMAPISVPVFAAPLPGSRMSSQDFWAERKARIEAIHAHLQERWQNGQERVSEVGAKP